MTPAQWLQGCCKLEPAQWLQGCCKLDAYTTSKRRTVCTGISLSTCNGHFTVGWVNVGITTNPSARQTLACSRLQRQSVSTTWLWAYGDTVRQLKAGSAFPHSAFHHMHSAAS